jgi:molybdopterin molybdotransferase
MISVQEALERILARFEPLPGDTVALDQAHGRTLSEDAVARVTQPPADLSAMDGYAIRFADVATVPTSLRVVGQAPAGGAYAGTLQAGEAVRIFTGGPVPAGADTIVIQENTSASGDRVTIVEPPQPGRHIRRAGLGFKAGQVGIPAGTRLSGRAVALAASMNLPQLRVHRRPRIALLATGNELVRPGEPIGRNQIVASSGIGLAAMIRAWGGEPVDLGIVPDDLPRITASLQAARGYDLLVTLGGASVGDHDLVQKALGQAGGALDFWKIAMRPGKPLMFGTIGAQGGTGSTGRRGTPLLGLPGNPVSALVCALLFLRPVVNKLAGRRDWDLPVTLAKLGSALPANDTRQDYLRAELAHDAQGELLATPFKIQDSSMMSALAKAGCLILRAPHAPAIAAGQPVEIVTLERLGVEF